MIFIQRGPEPSALKSVRKKQLAQLTALGRPPLSKEITGYDCVKGELWGRQYHKCCYCERKIFKTNNDVEHFRPKAEADRLPGSAATHGYWWLAFTWENLLFSCDVCNRWNKMARFPLEVGSTALLPHELPPGQERPFLLDPAGCLSPLEHLEYYKSPRTWRIRPRNGSLMGAESIRVYGLDGQDHQELYLDHVTENVLPLKKALRDALRSGHPLAIRQAFDRALLGLHSRCTFVGLTYDALVHFVPSHELAPWGLRWPEPSEVGRPGSAALLVGAP